jgi:hypothetical protein
MSLQRDRTREGAVGLGMLTVREVYPTPGASYQDMGWLDIEGTSIDPQRQILEHKDEAGDLDNISETESAHKFGTFLAQVGQDEIDFILNASGKDHSLRYYGMMNPWRHQYICAELAKIVPSIPRTWKVGKQNLPMTAYFLKQSNLAYAVPEYYLIETLGRMYLDNLVFWISSRRKWNDATAKILDASGFAYHGDLNSDYATIWQTATQPERFLRFDGSNDYASFGDVCDIGTNYAAIEFWVRIKGADGTLQEILTKKASNAYSDPGFWIERIVANNALKVYLSDGSNQDVITSNAAITQNVWNHILINIVDGPDVLLYVNGTLDNSVSHNTVSLSNAVSLYLARGGSGYGQVDIGDVRIHLKATSLDNIAMALGHYNAEKSYYPNS